MQITKIELITHSISLLLYRGGYSVMKIKQLFAVLTLMAIGLGTAQADYTLNLMEGVTSISKDVYGLHMLVLWVCVFIGIAVFGTMFYSIYFHRKSRGYKASNFHESTKVEILWTIIPTVILIALAIPATKVMLEMDDVQDSEMTIKVTGWQWKWEYEYLDSGVHFFSSLDEASNKARQLNSGIDPRTVPNYLLEVDKPLVVPINTKIRFLFTAADVIHSWWVPDLGWKKDTIPGFINEAWTSVEKAGTYRGQCTELCGKDHGFMPIVVIAMEKADYQAWVAEQKGIAVADAAAAEKEWSQADLIAKGESVYANNCASCHMADGAGMAGTFPAITKSGVVTGAIDAQVDLMLNGKGMMPAFGQMLDPVDFAAVSTFIRNGLGNSVGDSIQPAAVKALQAAIPAVEYDDDDDDE
ncbi:MAG: cytochrome c oxidase subunit II [Methyloprofundus sp.]|nr:MAG: cytochrome c oxidase subunit II [Methyloprofundus sp.]